MNALAKRIRDRIIHVERALAPVVSSLVEAVVDETMGSAGQKDPTLLRDTTTIMLERLRVMPRFLGIPMMGATVAFDAYGLVSAGRLFRNQAPEQRRVQIRQWRNAPIGFCGDFLDFYEKMAAFVYFSEQDERAGESREVTP